MLRSYNNPYLYSVPAGVSIHLASLSLYNAAFDVTIIELCSLVYACEVKHAIIFNTWRSTHILSFSACKLYCTCIVLYCIGQEIACKIGLKVVQNNKIVLKIGLTNRGESTSKAVQD